MFISPDVKLINLLPKGAQPVWDDRSRAQRQGGAQPTMAGDMSVQTPDGPVPIAWLRAGDIVQTWDGTCAVDAVDEVASDTQIMLVSLPGVIGTGLVDPYQHILLSGWEMELHFGAAQMLVEIGALADAQWQLCEVAQPRYRVTFKMPQVIQADGLWLAAGGADKQGPIGGAPMVMHPQEAQMLKLGAAARAI